MSELAQPDVCNRSAEYVLPSDERIEVEKYGASMELKYWNRVLLHVKEVSILIAIMFFRSHPNCLSTSCILGPDFLF